MELATALEVSFSSGVCPMVKVVVQWIDEETEGSCALCNAPLLQPAGAQLCLLPNMTPVCRNCGRQHASALSALLDLGGLAQHVGRVSRSSRQSSLRLPIGSLLELSRAAEDYYAHSLEGRKT